MFITQYALTKGIIEVDGDKVQQSNYDKKCFYIDGYFNGYLLGTNIFYPREEAVKVAGKVERVKKQLNEPQKMTFSHEEER